MRGFLEELNPSIKALAVMISAITLSFSYSIELNILNFLICIILLASCSRVKFSRLLRSLAPAVLMAIGLLMTGLLYTNGGEEAYSGSFIVSSISIGSLYNGIQLATRVFAFLGLGMLFSMTTKPKFFVDSLQHQAKFSPKFAYGILASLNLLPSIKEELYQAKLALKARGVYVGIFSLKPVFSMFVNTIYWSEALDIAMRSKGFDSEGKRSYYEVTKVYKKDIFFCLIICSIQILGLIYL